MTLINMLSSSFERNSSAVAIVSRDTRLSYSEWFQQISSVAGAIEEIGLRKGDHLVTILSNRYEMATLYWACQMLGLIFTPFNWRASGAEIAYVLEDAEAKLVVCETRSEFALKEALDLFPIPNERVVHLDCNKFGQNFASLLGAKPFNGPWPDDSKAICLMLYTSGTTGRPKGVPRSHDAEIFATVNCIAQLRYKYHQSNLGVMPLFHTMGVRTLLMSVFLDSTFVCLSTYEIKEVIKLVETERINNLFLVPTMFHDLVHSHLSGRDLSSVTNIAYAGMSMTTDLVSRCSNLFPQAEFSNFYGSSEIYTFAVRNNLAGNPGSAGRAGIGQRLKIVRADPDKFIQPNEEVPIGETGEIIASMASLDAFSGYWKRPDADKKAIRGGWYFTGDLGRFDANGEIYVLGRVDDMIISGGENIYAEEVEDVLAKSPDVRGVAVIGMPDSRWGEKVTAFIEPGSANLSIKYLDEFCLNSDLARFKRPKAYAFVQEIPRSASGKLMRRHLRTGDYKLLDGYQHSI